MDAQELKDITDASETVSETVTWAASGTLKLWRVSVSLLLSPARWLPEVSVLALPMVQGRMHSFLSSSPPSSKAQQRLTETGVGTVPETSCKGGPLNL